MFQNFPLLLSLGLTSNESPKPLSRAVSHFLKLATVFFWLRVSNPGRGMPNSVKYVAENSNSYIADILFFFGIVDILFVYIDPNFFLTCSHWVQ